YSNFVPEESSMGMTTPEQLRQAQSKAFSFAIGMIARWPALFAIWPPRPLAIDIDEEMMRREPQLNYALLDLFLGRWTDDATYLAELIPGKPRFGFNGEECGFVTEQEVTARLEERRKRGGLQK